MTGLQIDDALQRVLSARLDVSVTFASRPVPMTGGFWASIYAFEIAEGPTEWRRPLVLRVMPDRAVADREIAVQRTMAEQGFSTPAVLMSGFDEDLGGAFMVMPRASGASPLGSLKIGWGVLKLPGTLRRLPRQLSAVAASLHALDPVPVEDALAAVDAAAAGAAGGRHGVDARLRWVREAAQTESIGFDDLAGWFDHHRPSVAQPVVCHGDLHPFNLLIDDNGVVTVLDWTNANISAREFDLGFTAGLLRCAPISTPGIVQPLVRRLTNWMANDFVRRYAETAPVDPVALNWFEALQYARCLAELASARSGLTHVVGPDHPFETAAPAMLARLAALTSITLTLPQRQPAPAS